MTVFILLLVAALGVAFFLWSPSWLGPPEDNGGTRDERGSGQ